MPAAPAQPPPPSSSPFHSPTPRLRPPPTSPTTTTAPLRRRADRPNWQRADCSTNPSVREGCNEGNRSSSCPDRDCPDPKRARPDGDSSWVPRRGGTPCQGPRAPPLLQPQPQPQQPPPPHSPRSRERMERRGRTPAIPRCTPRRPPRRERSNRRRNPTRTSPTIPSTFGLPVRRSSSAPSSPPSSPPRPCRAESHSRTWDVRREWYAQRRNRPDGGIWIVRPGGSRLELDGTEGPRRRRSELPR
mmetsp:Transcript_35667/g.106435  ORF Transcript_35667/g.106435 Transcript_35667/m.106435 type:complete len:245 (+) Transcript_35667:562-1296(+)